MSAPVLRLRLVLETEDLDAALAFYRDALGLPELESYHGDGGRLEAPDGMQLTVFQELGTGSQDFGSQD